MNSKELLDRYATGERNFEDAELTGANLSGSQLVMVDLSGASLKSSNFSNASLSNARLIGADLNSANLQQSKMLGANLSGAQLNRADLSGSNLLGANLSGANLVNANLRGANLTGADLYYANLWGADLTDANLGGANLDQANLTLAHMSGTRLQGANLSSATLPESPSAHHDVAPRETVAAPKILGDFIEALPTVKEQLVISFSPSSIPLKTRWRQNGLSADFIADYFAIFFPEVEAEHDRINTATQIKESVCFIANELLENAMKYSCEETSIHTSITLQMHSGRLVFIASHGVSLQVAQTLQQFIHELLSSDPTELYIQRLEANARTPHSRSSGLGLLTMVNDYGASLGWQFEPIAQYPDAVMVKTMVQLTA